MTDDEGRVYVKSPLPPEVIFPRCPTFFL